MSTVTEPRAVFLGARDGKPWAVLDAHGRLVRRPGGGFYRFATEAEAGAFAEGQTVQEEDPGVRR